MARFHTRDMVFGDYFARHAFFRIPRDILPRREHDLLLGLCEAILACNPSDVDALTAAGHIYTEKGEYTRGLEMDVRLSRLRPESPLVWYNLACSYALVGRKKDALDALTEAVMLGYDDLAHMETDRDLDAVRGEKAYKELVDMLRRGRRPRRRKKRQEEYGT